MTQTVDPRAPWTPDHTELLRPAAPQADLRQPPAAPGYRPAPPAGDPLYVPTTWSQPGYRPEPVDLPISRGPRLDQARFWVGSILTAAVAGMAGVIGMVVAQGVLRVPVVLPDTDAALHIGTYGMIAALISMLAALVYDGMVAFAPRPTMYYGWLTGLLTALAVLLPFTTTASLVSQLVLAGTNLVVGVVIMTLVPVAASNARPR
ncbi:DUF6069 family protein [Nakamurella endophytica]|uniref:Uncharacterized protein n=1 Tax=Nakamurella endophytica TaxID=1748367 RepID=A0A917WJW3_9ACTN|nr:DUF6069 family protein [Nakamurella endophytica]GGM10431.1 hypothetical protein GCM10011594_32900 [Nakamurella endophytica]